VPVLPFSIKIFLADGTPDGLRVVKKTNWTGKALCFSRTGYADLRGSDELARPGVYVLTGPSESERYRQCAYIGEADDLHSRLRQHVREKEFWTQVVAFTSEDDDLNKAHVRYLEAKLIQKAKAADRSQLDNTGGAQVPHLSAPEAAYAEAFLTDMLLIYPLLGVEAFEPLDSPPTTAAPRLYLKAEDTVAEGRETPEGFLVFAGALGRVKTTPSFQLGFHRQRKLLADDGVLVIDGDHLRLTHDYVFNAPSTAASVLIGHGVNGRQYWKDISGRTLTEIQDTALVEPEGVE
jgi:Domain of unknown function (DUF4357)